jgi:periplasmic protein TonB
VVTFTDALDGARETGPARPAAWPRALGLAGTAALHGIALLAALLWPSVAPRSPEPLVVELVRERPPVPPTPLVDPSPPLASTPQQAPAVVEAQQEPLLAAPQTAPMELPPLEPLPALQPQPSPKLASRTSPPRKPARMPPVPSPPAAATAEATPAVEAAVAPPTSAAPAIERPQAIDDPAYATTLLRHLERFREYPRAARVRRLEGVALVRLAFGRDGHLLDARIERSSGHEALDDAALETIGRASPLPQPPPNLTARRTEVRVPFVYRLSGLDGGVAR